MKITREQKNKFIDFIENEATDTPKIEKSKDGDISLVIPFNSHIQFEIECNNRKKDHNPSIWLKTRKNPLSFSWKYNALTFFGGVNGNKVATKLINKYRDEIDKYKSMTEEEELSVLMLMKDKHQHKTVLSKSNNKE